MAFFLLWIVLPVSLVLNCLFALALVLMYWENFTLDPVDDHREFE